MKYKKIVQKKYCCVGACLEMVLNRHHIKNSGQEDIAYQLGLIVPYEDKDDYKKDANRRIWHSNTGRTIFY